MSVLFFFYTIGLMVICILIASTNLCAFLVSHRKLFIYVFGVFIFYCFDLALIFHNDYLYQNLPYPQDIFFNVNYPYLNTFLGGGYLLCIWLAVCDYLDERSSALQVIPIAVFVLASVLIAWLVPQGRFRLFWFYTMRQVFLFWVFAYLAFRYQKTADKVEKMRLAKYKKEFWLFLCLTVCIVMEDSYMSLLVQPYYFSPDFPLYLSERNFSENIFMICLAIWSFVVCARALSLRYVAPPENESTHVLQFIDSNLQSYCNRNHLSEREGEVLRLVLLGEDNQNIASKMNIALGTVKRHVHNIFDKTDTHNRQELIQDFWRN